ncbi:hypothetical protein IWX49DRAFT_585859 [Phyllosticta citricarpa]|uniref:Ubiquitin-like protease family profile domain-containing protein n=1 Tax=Phyllosticta paracitricarpa TaxID=2016321 RepID=A0ABR1MTI9_9PEZI
MARLNLDTLRDGPNQDQPSDTESSPRIAAAAHDNDTENDRDDEESDGDEDDDENCDESASSPHHHPYPELARNLAGSRWALDEASFLVTFDESAYHSREFLRQLKNWATHGKLSLEEAVKAMRDTWDNKMGWPRRHKWVPLILTTTLEELHAQGLEIDVDIRKGKRGRLGRKKSASPQSDTRLSTESPRSTPEPSATRNISKESTFRPQSRGNTFSLFKPGKRKKPAAAADQDTSFAPKRRMTRSTKPALMSMSMSPPTSRNKSSKISPLIARPGRRSPSVEVGRALVNSPTADLSFADGSTNWGFDHPDGSDVTKPKDRTASQATASSRTEPEEKGQDKILPRGCDSNTVKSVSNNNFPQKPPVEEPRDADASHDIDPAPTLSHKNPTASSGTKPEEKGQDKILPGDCDSNTVKFVSDNYLPQKPLVEELRDANPSHDIINPATTLSDKNWVSASAIGEALEIFGPVSCRTLDSTVADVDGKGRLPMPRLTIGKHHTEAVLPVLRNGNHWALAILDLSGSTVKYFDSMETMVPPQAKNVLKELGQQLCREREWSFETAPTAQQTNLDDCGVYAIAAVMNHWYGDDPRLGSIDAALWRVTLRNALLAHKSKNGQPEPLAILDFEHFPDDEEAETRKVLDVEVGSLDDSSLKELDRSLRTKIESLTGRLVGLRSRGDFKALPTMLSGSKAAAERLLTMLEHEIDEQQSLREDFVAIRDVASQRAASSQFAQNREKLIDHGLAEIQNCDKELTRLETRKQDTQATIFAIDAAMKTSDEYMRRLRVCIKKQRETGNRLKDLNSRIQQELASRKDSVWSKWDDVAKSVERHSE